MINKIEIIYKTVFYGPLVGLSSFALITFLYEIYHYQAWLNSIWITLSFEQQTLANWNLGVMDVKIMLAVLCLALLIKFIWDK